MLLRLLEVFNFSHLLNSRHPIIGDDKAGDIVFVVSLREAVIKEHERKKAVRRTNVNTST